MSTRLDEEEFRLLSDQNLLPSKFQIGAKIDRWLSALHLQLKPIMTRSTHLPSEVRGKNGKISRGENYHLQAYRVLDYPRMFSKTGIYAFRTIVLWGHPIGFHLILSGIYKDQYQQAIIDKREQLAADFFLATHETPWIWEADTPEFVSCGTLTQSAWEAHVAKYEYLKISYFLPLSQYETLVSTGERLWTMWVDILRIY